jgi:hypothetical protein
VTDCVALRSHALEPLDEANAVFRDAYQSRREHAWHVVPVLVLLPTEVVLRCSGERKTFPVFCGSFCAAKDVAHIAVALFTLSLEQPPLVAEALARVRALRAHVASALQNLDDPTLAEVRPGLTALLELALAFSDKVAQSSATVADERAAFARHAGPQLLRITELATCEQLATLHRVVEQALATLSNEDRMRLQIVVVGDHQARSRSLGMQYFQRRLGERPGDDERVTYGENIADEAEAVALVGTRQLDRAIAGAFFGDEKRLQRDVLGDAAKACLEGMKLPQL